MPLSCGPALEKSFCGTCIKCVRACPAGALTGRAWHPGVSRDAILDAAACDTWKKQHFFAYHKGHNCGICSSVCPYSVKTLKNDGSSQHQGP
ncbi:MAG: 4Fe-4S double cluster binding domain-containing protein [Desulfosalsimonas sp.]|uniref:4Fe-4S double cluster binding domain-containing protein n=1 Tax=Desulfosalsimonas sp. TaxID=3073848 RepID=UPI0039710E3D